MKDVSVVIEDVSTIQKMIRTMLISRGYQVEPLEPEVSKIEDDAWFVELTFVVTKRW